MPSNRTVVLTLGAVGVVAAAGISALVFAGTDPAPAPTDLIAYGCKEQGNRWYAICSVQPDGSEPSRLTERLQTTDPVWSPDGRRLAFTRNEDEGESTLFTVDDVFVMDADGGGQRQVTPDDDSSWSGQPDWSPDGRELVFVRGQKVSSAVQSKYGTLYRIDVDGGTAQRLAASRTDTDPDWSPDGRTIAFVRGEDLASPTEANDDLWVLDVATGAARPLTRTPPGTFEEAPAWSPDGSRIAFARVTPTSQFDGTASIHLVGPDGRDEELLLRHKLFAYAPYSLAWSADGRTIAFETSSVIGCISISLVDVASRSIRPLTACTRPREATVAPAWRPAAGGAD